MSDNTKYKAQVFCDGVIKKAVQEEIEKLAMAVLGNHKLKIDFCEEGFDQYPYCKHETKSFCPIGSRIKKYKGNWREYVVFGHTKTDVYLEVLRMLANKNSTYYPIVSFRYDDDWFERDKVTQL